ncbi:aconitate hydratase AcnA [Rhizobium sp. XQZ8]|uniref:aconitate hydratase AcnA n=1 Tax=Rhizobium populisoli TaxID=2859785 RepID=UPI001CA53ED0|nr:aconitate hydratase AcnA [Rhizobium populisoli]MBW6425036.1 aconitate hydratase AcnA [Rhizobium populisoli]
MTFKITRIAGQKVRIVDLQEVFGRDLYRLPYLMRIILENCLRHADGSADAIIGYFRDWLERGTSSVEIAFRPGRLMMHDTTCVPALVDMAALRATLSEIGGDPGLLNPALRVDVSVDHSIAVDAYGSPDALATNIAREIERNSERYRLMKWAMNAFEHIKVHPPGTGIMHTMNLEQFASVIAESVTDGETHLFPDTLIGTDSHTPMVNGIGVLAWGVGGLEAESVMFGMPVMLRIPDVIGVRLSGRLAEGVLSTDLALVVTERLRAYGLSGEFVEFFGPGVSTLSAGDRAVVANMTPEFGGATGYFPIDDRTVDYLAATGRSQRSQDIVRDASRFQGLWFDPDTAPRYSDVIEIDLSAITTSLAGPRRPQDRMSPDKVPAAVEAHYHRPLNEHSDPNTPPDGAVAIAAITSCTNTTDPRLLIAAGLLARNARRLGLKPAWWVKTSLAPGSPAAASYLRRSGLMEDLSAVGFDIVGFGCTTCIGNSGPLERSMEAAVKGGTAAVAVLSGNRNFPGRVHPALDAGFLASPPLVIAYAIAGDTRRDILRDPLGFTAEGKPVLLADIWPDSKEIDAVQQAAIDPAEFGPAFQQAEENAAWAALDAPSSMLFPWDMSSTYVRRPPFASIDQPPRIGSYKARPLLVVGNDITTDHISPAGQIPLGSDTAGYLIERGDDPADLNVFASRRGNWEAMIRGLFTNRSVVNLLDPGLKPGTTIHATSGEVLPLWRAAERYAAEDVSVVVVAGERCGAGSSRDWAAKGVALLGARAVLTRSFERIHRSNLVGMGILPLLLPEGQTPETLGLTAQDWIEIDAEEARIRPGGTVKACVIRGDRRLLEMECRMAIETELEVSLLKTGGIMPFILKRAMNRSSMAS